MKGHGCFIKILFCIHVMLILALNCYCQGQTFRIVGSNTRNPVPFATVKFLTKPGGTIASESGEFFAIVSVHDTIQITSVGFEALLVDGRNIKSLIELKPKAVVLTPVFVREKTGSRHIRLGYLNNRKKADIHWGPGVNVEFAQKITLPDSLKSYNVKHLLIPIRVENCFSPFILRLYLPDTTNGLPGEEIFLRKVGSNQVRIKQGKAYVDLSDSDVFVERVPFFYVSFSWLPDSKMTDDCLTVLGMQKVPPVGETNSFIRTSAYNFVPWIGSKNPEGNPERYKLFITAEVVEFK